MTMPTFLAPGWGWMGLIAVPIVLLYLLRQRRPDMAVSSTLLWSKALADMRASTPFQKFRRNLLLLLQLLALAALVLTLMRPVVQAKAQQGAAGIIVIDATASMQTKDGGADESRLDRAKAEAHKLVDSMRPSDQYMLIADGGGMAQVRSGFTSSKSELHGLIDSVKASDTSSDLSESLLLAATSLRAIGGDRAGPAGAPETKTELLTAGKVWLFSDGAGVHVPDTMGESNSLLQFVRIGSSDHSIGITRLSITPVPKEAKTYQVFVGLKNAWPVEKRVGVLLAYGTKDNFMPEQAKFVVLPPNNAGGVGGGGGSVVFEKVVADPGKLFVRVDDADDDFPLDNIAYGIIAPARKPRVVLVTAGNALLENLITTANKVGKAEGQIVAPEAYDPASKADLFILDGFVPPADKFPKADTLLIRPQITVKEPGAVVDVGGFKVSHVIENPSILTWRREDPIMQAVGMGEVRVLQALLMDRDPSAVELVSTLEGPLIAYKDVGSVRRYFVSFNPMVESNWWSIPTLIVFMQNVIEQTRERHFIGMPQLTQSGTPAKLWNVGDPKDSAGGGGTVKVTMPDGSTATVAAKDGTAEFGETDRVGFYDVLGVGTAGGGGGGGGEGGGEKAMFAVNLLSAAESDITPRSLQTVQGGAVEEVRSVAAVNKEVWRWVAAAALLVLVAEWWVYHRRLA